MTVIPVSALQPSDMLILGNNILPAVHRDRWRKRRSRGRRRNRRRNRDCSAARHVDQPCDTVHPAPAA